MREDVEKEESRRSDGSRQGRVGSENGNNPNDATTSDDCNHCLVQCVNSS